MATARIHHRNEDLDPQPIITSSSGTISPPTYIIANGQPVTFTNNSASTINITFEPDAFGVVVFNNVTLNPGTSDSQTPQANDRTVNFNTDGTANYPYAIQVGAGPMYVAVTAGVCTPDKVVIPLNGTIEMIGTDQNYNVHWNASNGDPFTPPLSEIYTSGNPLTKTHRDYLPVADYGYTISPAGPCAGPGGGRVVVKNT